MYGILKKKYGQNFLIDKNILLKISKLISIKDLNIIEIGPGDGRLTEYILNYNPKKLILIEIDKELISQLNSKFFGNKKLKILNEDILKYKFIGNIDLIISNLPYNISSQVLAKICLLKNLPDKLILMFQKEVADRIIAKINNSNYGRLSVLVNWKLNIMKISDIKPSSFKPKPKVDSSLLFFTPKKDFFKIKNPKNLEKITRIFFSNRRKMIKKPYNQIFNGDLRVLEKLKINLNLRPQNLSYETYYKLTDEYEKLTG